MLQDDFSKKLSECQSVESELKKKFEPKKAQSEILGECYTRLQWNNKAKRVFDCGSWLEFRQARGLSMGAPVANCAVRNGSGAPIQARPFKLSRANFCRERLCPMCSWRRSLKIFGQVSKIMEYLDNQYRYIFLTLTVPNCIPEKLSEVIDDMVKGFNRLMHLKAVKGAVKGYFRVLEVTRNKRNGTYHPHFHIVLAVSCSYFDSRYYIKHDEWLRMWQQSMKDDSITQVDVRTIKNKKTGETSGAAVGSAVAEVAKYAVKASDYVLKSNPQLMDEIVTTLTGALGGRRLTAFSGCFKQAREDLELDDCENGDLIHLDGDIRNDLGQMIYKFKWSAGCYKLVSSMEIDENGEVIE